VNRLVVDAGAFIGLFYSKDTHHSQCVQGFSQLAKQNVTLLVPIPIVFEVYKWLLQKTNVLVARRSLQIMHESIHTVPVNQSDFEELQAMLERLSDWQGTLEDASVVSTAILYKCAVWTFNYRDFVAFSEIEFWNPK
jgi:predicted nucleic acid-binding protein